MNIKNKQDKKNNGGITAESGTQVNTGLGATNYNDIKLATAPVLLKIKSGKVVALYYTKTEIKAQLNNLIANYK